MCVTARSRIQNTDPKLTAPQEPPSKAKFTSAQYNSPVFFDQSSGLVRQSANATIPIGNKGINVQFIRVPGRVVVSRAAEAALIVESQWSGDGKFGANVNFMNDNRNTFVSISVSVVVCVFECSY
jgi:hypothetical protein